MDEDEIEGCQCKDKTYKFTYKEDYKRTKICLLRNRECRDCGEDYACFVRTEKREGRWLMINNHSQRLTKTGEQFLGIVQLKASK